MYDPTTFGFWYFNERNRSNVWKCPQVFQQNLVCKWDGFQAYGGGESGGQRCRCVFNNLSEYHTHMYTAHKWFCPACDTKNPGIVFPRCAMCDNITSENGENTEKVHCPY
jgi:hypothetical protein